MIKRSSHLLSTCFLCVDLLLTGLMWVAAYYVRVESGWIRLLKSPPLASLCWRDLPLVVSLAAISFHLTGQYTIHRLRRFREEVVGVVKGTALLVLMVMGSIFFMQNHYDSRLTMILFGVLTATAVLTGRRLSWAAVRQLRSAGYNQTNCIIVGTGRVARKTARSLRHTAWLGIHTIGFVEDQPSRWTSDLNILGTTVDLPAFIARYNVGYVFICLPMSRYHDARRVFDILSRTLVEVRLVADVPDMAGLSLTTANLDGLPVIGLRESSHFGLNIVFKRAMDVAMAFIGLILLSPLLLVLAILVKLTSPGPVFYRQERCGLNGRTFVMYKFRSMRVDAEQQTGAVWASRGDPRRTRLGTFLRKTSLDELPQLFNVFKGDMSLVGPRPERPVFTQRFTQTIPNYMARHCVKAGITGWAQVHGYRGNTSLRKRIQYDLYYITHWTPWLDLRILWMTLFRGIINRNAY